MHVEMKFTTNIRPPEEDEGVCESSGGVEERSPSPTRSVYDGFEDIEIA